MLFYQPGTVMCIVRRILRICVPGWSSVLPTWNTLTVKSSYISAVCTSEYVVPGTNHGISVRPFLKHVISGTNHSIFHLTVQNTPWPGVRCIWPKDVLLCKKGSRKSVDFLPPFVVRHPFRAGRIFWMVRICPLCRRFGRALRLLCRFRQSRNIFLPCCKTQ